MNYQLVLAALNELKSGHIEDTSKGICFNLAWKLDMDRNNPLNMSTHFIEEAFTSIFGSVLTYPVEGDIFSYLNNKNKWDKETEMGLRRFDLLDKMIAYAEEQLNKEEA